MGTPGGPNLCEVPPVGDPIDLSIELTDEKTPAELGKYFRYEVIVVNDSEDFDTLGTWDVVLELPPGLILKKDKSDKRWDCDLDAFPLVRCTYDSGKPVDAGKKSKKISFEVIASNPEVFRLTATAWIDLEGALFHDPNPGNNEITIETGIEIPEMQASSLTASSGQAP
jgi:hypothetical protein